MTLTIPDFFKELFYAAFEEKVIANLISKYSWTYERAFEYEFGPSDFEIAQTQWSLNFKEIETIESLYNFLKQVNYAKHKFPPYEARTSGKHRDLWNDWLHLLKKPLAPTKEIKRAQEMKKMWAPNCGPGFDRQGNPIPDFEESESTDTDEEYNDKFPAMRGLWKIRDPSEKRKEMRYLYERFKHSIPPFIPGISFRNKETMRAQLETVIELNLEHRGVAEVDSNEIKCVIDHVLPYFIECVEKSIKYHSSPIPDLGLHEAAMQYKLQVENLVPIWRKEGKLGWEMQERLQGFPASGFGFSDSGSIDHLFRYVREQGIQWS